MSRYWIGVGAIVALSSSPALAVGANCGDQLAQIKAQASSELLAQSAIANKYKEAERLCNAGQDMQAQDMARQIREEMEQKGAAGSSHAPASAATSTGSTTGQSK